LSGIYVCGPTVYGHAHIGHAKVYVSFDVIVRYLRYLGYRVRYVQNITDVGHLTDDADEGEDKILRRARQERVEPMELVETYMRSYFEDMDALNVRPARHLAPGHGHIPEQIELVERCSSGATPTRPTARSTLTCPAGPSMASSRGARSRSRKRAPGGSQPRQAPPGRLCRLEAGRAGPHPALAQPLGLGLSRLAPGVLGDGHQVPGPAL
jgi:hypothetical protein